MSRSGYSDGRGSRRMMQWCLSNRADPRALPLADRHYSRQKPGTSQFVKPGSCLVLLTACNRALWVTSWQKPEYIDHAWPGPWECALFRNEGAGLATDLIHQALAVTRWHYGDHGYTYAMITFIDPKKLKPTMVRGAPVFGWTFRKVGFEEIGQTKSGKIVLGIKWDKVPAPQESAFARTIAATCGSNG